MLIGSGPLTDPNVSPEAKAHAKHMLELHGIKL